MEKRLFLILFLFCAIFVLIGFAVWFFFFQKQPQGYSGQTEEVKIEMALRMPEFRSLINLADDLGYFSKNGVKVSLNYQNSSADVIKNLKEGKIDIGAVGDFTFVSESFSNENISILTSFTKSDNVVLIGRKDEGISEASDLKGKKIGIIPKTALEFFLGEFLALSSLSIEGIEAVAFQNGEQETQALIDGRVDAIAINSRLARQIEQRLKEKTITWSIQNGRLFHWLAVVRKDESRQGKFERFIGALVEAENYLKKNPEKAKEIIGKYLPPEDKDFLMSNWSKFKFTVDLSQELIISLEDQARWAIENGLTDAAKVPNYLDYIYFDALEAARPEAINIIR